jgi:hypothetical protein
MFVSIFFCIETNIFLNTLDVCFDFGIGKGHCGRHRGMCGMVCGHKDQLLKIGVQFFFFYSSPTTVGVSAILVAENPTMVIARKSKQFGHYKSVA